MTDSTSNGLSGVDYKLHDAPALPVPGPRAGRILVVDDHHPIARALASVLSSEGYEVAIFHRGTEALAYAKDQPCLAAVIDIHLPDTNGLIVAQQLRELFGPRKPIFVLSGDTSMNTLSALSGAGATQFFSKPVKPQLLLDQLRQQIENH